MDQIGSPAAIELVPDDRQRGPLLVTLATELACVAVDALHDGLTDGLTAREIDGFMVTRGGDAYRHCLERYRHACRTKAEVLQEIIALEGRVLRFGAGELTPTKPPSELATKTVEGDFLMWLATPACGPQTASEWREKHSCLHAKLRAITKETESLWHDLAGHRDRISGSEDFEDSLRVYLDTRGTERESEGKRIVFDFATQHPPMLEGAGAILRSTDEKWWRAFGIKLNARVNKQANRSPVRFMMRDVFLSTISRRLSERAFIGVDEAWLQVLSTPSKLPDLLKRETGIPGGPGVIEWLPYTGRSNQGINDEDIRKWKNELRKEDRRTRGWLENNAGAFHPCDWIRNSPDASVPASRERHRHLVTYPAVRAKNELYWCLCRHRGETFVPMASVKFPAVAWLAWVREAELGYPPYWSRGEVN